MIPVADHFCGAGGESTGIMAAAEELGIKLDLLAVNHWARAIETHKKNHPGARHQDKPVESLDPSTHFPDRYLKLLWASPECTHFSTALGGKPRLDQKRASAWHIMKWVQDLYVERVIVENVPEFVGWGPVGKRGKALKSKKGQTFKAWVSALESLGYTVEWRVLRAADYGDPTTRRRLFIQAVRGSARILWPEPTHTDQPEIYNRSPWVPAREIIDWSIPGKSIFDRKKPLADATIRRIEAGIKRFWGEWAEPFMVILRGTGSVRDLDLPVPAVTAGGNHLGLCQPFVTKYHGGDPNRNHSIDAPLPTLDCSNRLAVVEPFIYASGHRSSIRVSSINDPLSTVVTKAEHCLVEPLIMEYYGNGRVWPVSVPLPTVTCKDRFLFIQGVPHKLDILFRMLQPHELGAAQGFPRTYWFSGNKGDQVRQIGNAVPCNTAKALAKCALQGAVA